MPLSKYARFIDRLRCGGSLAYTKRQLSIICCAGSPKARSEHSLRSSRKSESDFVLELKVSLCQLCYAVVCDCGLTYFRRNMLSTSSKVRFLLALIFLKVCSASLRRCEKKWLTFIASVFCGCILRIV